MRYEVHETTKTRDGRPEYYIRKEKRFLWILFKYMGKWRDEYNMIRTYETAQVAENRFKSWFDLRCKNKKADDRVGLGGDLNCENCGKPAIKVKSKGTSDTGSK